LISNDIKNLINISEGIFQTKSPPNQKLIAAQNIAAALAPTAMLVYAGSRHLKNASQIDGRALTQMEQARDWLNTHGGLSKESILKNFNNPAISNIVTRMDDVSKLNRLAGTAKYGAQADLLNKGIFSSKEDIAKGHELVATASGDPEKLLTRGSKAVDAVKAEKAHTSWLGQQHEATPATPAVPEGATMAPGINPEHTTMLGQHVAGTSGNAVDLSKSISMPGYLNPAMITAGAGSSLAVLGAGYLLKKGVQKYQKVRYGIEQPKDIRTGKQKTFDTGYTVARSLGSKGVSVATGAATISGLGALGAAGLGLASSTLAPALIGGYAGYKAGQLFSKGASALKNKIDASRQKQVKIKDIEKQIRQLRQDKDLEPADIQQQLLDLNKEKSNVIRGVN